MIGAEQFWQGLGVLEMAPDPWGPQGIPAGEDVDFSRQDSGFGWDQGVTMDRQPVDRYAMPLSSLASPPGLPVSVDSTFLHLERNQGNNAERVTPQLRNDGLGDRFDSYLNIIQWAPTPEVTRSYGADAPVRDDVLPSEGKMLLDPGYFGVIDTQQLLDEAIARTRRAMYGR